MRFKKYKTFEFADVASGGTPSTRNQNFWNGDVPWITPKDLANYQLKYISGGERNISEEGLKNSSAKLLPKNTVLLTSRAPVGYVAIAKNQLATNQGFKNLICNKDISDYNFIYYLLKSNKVYLESKATGSTFKEISGSRLKQMDFFLPSIDIQRKIAIILSQYDNLIENNLRRIKLLEESARLLYREWFVHLRFPGHEHTKIIDGVPEGWEKISLSELVTTQYGYTQSASEDPIGPKFLRGTDINKNPYIDWSRVPYCSGEELKLKNYLLCKNDIVIIRMADPGKVAIVEKDIEAVFASYLIRLKILDNRLKPYYLFFSLLDDRYQSYIKNSSTGSTRKSASAGHLVNFDILLPPRTLINAFEDYVIPIRRAINNLLDQNSKLRQARDILLPRLMNGDIAV